MATEETQTVEQEIEQTFQVMQDSLGQVLADIKVLDELNQEVASGIKILKPDPEALKNINSSLDHNRDLIKKLKIHAKEIVDPADGLYNTSITAIQEEIARLNKSNLPFARRAVKDFEDKLQEIQNREIPRIYATLPSDQRDNLLRSRLEHHTTHLQEQLFDIKAIMPLHDQIKDARKLYKEINQYSNELYKDKSFPKRMYEGIKRSFSRITRKFNPTLTGYNEHFQQVMQKHEEHSKLLLAGINSTFKHIDDVKTEKAKKKFANRIARDVREEEVIETEANKSLQAEKNLSKWQVRVLKKYQEARNILYRQPGSPEIADQELNLKRQASNSDVNISPKTIKFSDQKSQSTATLNQLNTEAPTLTPIRSAPLPPIKRDPLGELQESSSVPLNQESQATQFPQRRTGPKKRAPLPPIPTDNIHATEATPNAASPSVRPQKAPPPPPVRKQEAQGAETGQSAPSIPQAPPLPPKSKPGWMNELALGLEKRRSVLDEEPIDDHKNEHNLIDQEGNGPRVSFPSASSNEEKQAEQPNSPSPTSSKAPPPPPPRISPQAPQGEGINQAGVSSSIPPAPPPPPPLSLEGNNQIPQSPQADSNRSDFLKHIQEGIQLKKASDRESPSSSPSSSRRNALGENLKNNMPYVKEEDQSSKEEDQSSKEGHKMFPQITDEEWEDRGYSSDTSSSSQHQAEKPTQQSAHQTAAPDGQDTQLTSANKEQKNPVKGGVDIGELANKIQLRNMRMAGNNKESLGQLTADSTPISSALKSQKVKVQQQIPGR